MTTPGILPPNPIDWRNLIQAGRDLLNQQFTGHTLTREHARRAISIAYYSLFHALAESNAASLIGTLTDAASAAAWSRVYRGLPQHGPQGNPEAPSRFLNPSPPLRGHVRQYATVASPGRLRPQRCHFHQPGQRGARPSRSDHTRLLADSGQRAGVHCHVDPRQNPLGTTSIPPTETQNPRTSRGHSLAGGHSLQMVGKAGLEPARPSAHDPKSCSSTNSDTSPEPAAVRPTQCRHDEFCSATENRGRMGAFIERRSLPVERPRAAECT